MCVTVYLPNSLWKTTYANAVDFINKEKSTATAIKRWEDSDNFYEDFKDKQERCVAQIQISKRCYTAFPVKLDSYEYV